jgi:hypothetical protein
MDKITGFAFVIKITGFAFVIKITGFAFVIKQLLAETPFVIVAIVLATNI